MPGSFFLFASFAFAGSVFFYRAFRLALPNAYPGLYMLLVFLSPSILFWPSSLGKDAWIFLCTGLVALGWATYSHRGQLSGLLVLSIALLLINLIRAHIAAFLAVSLAAAVLLQGAGGQRSARTWLIGALAILVLAGAMLLSGADFLRIDTFTVGAVEDFYEDQQTTSFDGGSAFKPPNIFNPIGAVYGIITSLFRPFPWEAHNPQSLFSAVEALGWMVLLWVRRRVFWERFRMLLTSPVLAFAFVYTLLLSLGLTVSGNFGIVARQRVMFLPLFWMIFA
jgi:hypothetical protein